MESRKLQSLPETLYLAQQTRELDRIAIEDHGIAGYTLMQRAAEAAWLQLQRAWPTAQSVIVLCGAGNNAGDGYLIARLAHAAGLQVRVIALLARDQLAGDAATAAAAWAEIGEIEDWRAQSLDAADVIVDALFGTGLAREVTGDWAQAINAINARQTRGVLAVDIPSGLAADTGQPLGVAVKASQTASFIGLKLGLFTGSGPAHVGELQLHDLAVPPEVYTRVSATARLQSGDFRQQFTALQPRSRCSHKGKHGHVLVVGGNRGMGGAARMAGEAALRCGAGLVSLAVHPELAAVLNISRPELMCHGIHCEDDLAALLKKADVIAVGPGLGQDDFAQQLFGQAMNTDKPKIIDADALNLLAQQSPSAYSRGSDWVLTPHPGEAGRLLGSDSATIQADRLAAINELTARYQQTVVLKGCGSMIAGPGQTPWVCPAGNPGMATGGMGDVLTGVIASLMGQGLGGFAAASLGVWLHATAADRAAVDGQRGLLPSDLFTELRQLVNS